MTSDAIMLRPPVTADGAAVHRLVERCKPLDLNSCYAYLLLCTHFTETCVVVEMNGSIMGFLSAYLPPGLDRTLFVWQVAVDEGARGQGLAGRMIDHVLARDACRGIRYLETTVSPSNQPSQRLFLALAERYKARCRQTALFTEDMFEGGSHEAEVLFRIGPFGATGI